MNRRQPFHRLDLDEQLPLYHQIDSKAFSQDHALEFDHDGFLPLHVQAGTTQGLRQDGLIDRFEEARSQARVDPEPAIHGYPS
jgi:hypothetical protein